MAWGSAQESASVYALLQVFPDARVGEVRFLWCLASQYACGLDTPELLHVEAINSPLLRALVVLSSLPFT